MELKNKILQMFTETSEIQVCRLLGSEYHKLPFVYLHIQHGAEPCGLQAIGVLLQDRTVGTLKGFPSRDAVPAGMSSVFRGLSGWIKR